MKITLEPTSTFLEVPPSTDQGTFEARVWVGQLDDGHEVQALIFNVAAPGHPDQQRLGLRLAHETVAPPRKIAWVDDDTTQRKEPRRAV
jgi:hypothetical protein